LLALRQYVCLRSLIGFTLSPSRKFPPKSLRFHTLLFDLPLIRAPFELSLLSPSSPERPVQDHPTASPHQCIDPEQHIVIHGPLRGHHIEDGKREHEVTHPHPHRRRAWGERTPTGHNVAKEVECRDEMKHGHTRGQDPILQWWRFHEGRR